MTHTLVPVILSGGSGTRLWPLSRKLLPKQFLSLNGDGTMLQQTVARLSGLETAPPMVICNDQHRFIVAEQLREQGIEQPHILLEPQGRNTAPAIAIAAFEALKCYKNPLLLVLAADHLIADEPGFRQAVEVANQAAAKGKLVTFGVVPTSAETGYGYIKRGTPVNGDGVWQVGRFVEKPDAEVARQYLDSGEYYWNSGSFLFQADTLLEELKKYSPEIHDSAKIAWEKSEENFGFKVLGEDFIDCPADSIDYAVMEKTRNAAVVPLDVGWSDIGSWCAMWQVSAKDEEGNACHGDVVTHSTKNSLIYSDTRLVATVGMEDVIVIETSDAVLIANKDNAQDIKTIVEKLKQNKRNETDLHRHVYRPWGMYDSIDTGSRHNVKRITVKPGAKLSVQKHLHRAEHWVVVSGTALVRKDDETIMLTENESTYIHVGQVHSLENTGKIPLELIEVQTGSYLGEDDIIRIEDRYGREKN